MQLDGQPVTRFGTDKTRALLAYLAVEAGREHRRAMLAGLLWPEVSETAAHHNLSQALFVLRKLLNEKDNADPFLLATGQTLRFNPESSHILDVAVFQAGVAVCGRGAAEPFNPAQTSLLVQALDCYRGEFLSDPWLIDSQAFEEWRLLKQAEYHLLALQALSCLGRYYEQQREYALLARCARRQIEMDPLRESAHRQLMQSLALAGHRSEALTQYVTCQALLERELGIAPAPETTALYEQIRADRLTALPFSERRSVTIRTDVLRSSPVFVGREVELGRLDAALALVKEGQGQGQVLFVAGPAGSGKTSLLTAFVRSALATYDNLLVVNGGGNAYTGPGNPYCPFLEMLRQLQGDIGGGEVLVRSQLSRLAEMRSVLLPILIRYIPDLEHFLPGGKPPGGGLRPEPGRLFAQIMWVLQDAAARYPLVLVLDDLQWVDRDSLNLLFYLAGRLIDRPVLIVGALRSDVLSGGGSLPEGETVHPLAALIHELQHRWGDIRIDLAQTDGRAFVDALLDSEPNCLGSEFRENLYRHTGGQALFTAELLRGMQERGDLIRNALGYWVESAGLSWNALPARVEGAIAVRIGQLLPEWQSMLAAASVEGDEFTLQVVAQIHGLPESEVGQRLSGVLTRQYYLVVPVGVEVLGGQSVARYRFRHLLFQKYLYSRLDPVERARLHLAVGRALEALYGEQTAEISLMLVRHFELGGEPGKAVTYLIQAGWRATYLAAAEEALQLLTHGLALLKCLPPSAERVRQETELQLALATALMSKGWSTPERAQACERAYELCRLAGDADLLARSLSRLADVHLARGQFAAVAQMGVELLTLAETMSTPLFKPFAHYVLGSADFFQGQFASARQHLDQAVFLLSRQELMWMAFGEDRIGLRSRVWLTLTLAMLGHIDQAVACSRQTVVWARESGDTLVLGFAVGIGELCLGYCIRDTGAIQVALHQMTALGQDASLGVFQRWALLMQAWLDAVIEHDPAGLTRIRQLLDEWEGAGNQGGRYYHCLLLIEASLAVDRPEIGLEFLNRLETVGVGPLQAEIERLRGEVLCRLNRLVEAEGCFLRAIAVAEGQSARFWELRARTSLCRLYQSQGQHEAWEAARQSLVELVAWFKEGRDMPDLKDAAALVG